MLKVEKDSRQVPKTKEICASKKYYDLLYSYLQCHSEKRDDGSRFIGKKEVNFTKLGNVFGITRQTASTKFKNLKELGLVKECEDGFEIITLEKDIASLVPY